MERISARSVAVAAAMMLAGALAGPAASRADAPESKPGLVKTRWGTTPRGATRVVFQLDRTAEYRTSRLPGKEGVEAHLLGVVADPLPAPMTIGSGGVTVVTFHADPSGLVARVEGSGTPLTSKSFRLDDPPRVVVDLYPGQPEKASAPKDLARKESAHEEHPAKIASPVTKSPRRDDRSKAASPAKRGGSAEPPSPPPGTPQTTHVDPAPKTPKAAPPAAASSGDDDSSEEMDEVVSWITDLGVGASALKLSATEEDRARHLRSIALLLSERGLAREAETMLAGALRGGHGNPDTAAGDSLRLAELRLETGNPAGAAAVARRMTGAERTPVDRVRAARILVRCGAPDVAATTLEDAIPRLSGADGIEARLLLARAYWARNDIESATRHLEKVTGSDHVPAELMGPALVLEADCAWARGRTGDSERMYRRALREKLDDDDASWATLQLGNAARRDGRVAEAVEHYRAARDRWPDTFFGAQADWLLRLTERADLEAAEAPRDRG